MLKLFLGNRQVVVFVHCFFRFIGTGHIVMSTNVRSAVIGEWKRHTRQIIAKNSCNYLSCVSLFVIANHVVTRFATDHHVTAGIILYLEAG